MASSKKSFLTFMEEMKNIPSFQGTWRSAVFQDWMALCKKYANLDRKTIEKYRLESTGYPPLRAFYQIMAEYTKMHKPKSGGKPKKTHIASEWTSDEHETATESGMKLDKKAKGSKQLSSDDSDSDSSDEEQETKKKASKKEQSKKEQPKKASKKTSKKQDHSESDSDSDAASKSSKTSRNKKKPTKLSISDDSDTEKAKTTLKKMDLEEESD